MISREDMLIEYQGEADKVLQGCEQLNGQQLAECIPEVDCMCDDAGNNTFSCVRTMKMDETDQKVLQNLVYCEFVDSENFIEGNSLTRMLSTVHVYSLSVQYD